MGEPSHDTQDESNSAVGRRIQRRRAMLGMTQAQLGSHVGVSDKQIAKYESGKNRVGASRLWDIACVLGVEVSYFFADLSAQDTPPEKTSSLDGQSEELLHAFWTIQDPSAREELMLLIKALSKTKSPKASPA